MITLLVIIGYIVVFGGCCLWVGPMLWPDRVNETLRNRDYVDGF